MDMHWKSAGRTFAVATLALLALATASAQDQGELWETSAQASIPGMPVKMPAYKSQTCQKAEWTHAPSTNKDESGNCKTTDFVRTDTKITWKTVCTDPPMNGEGEINFNGTDSYVGAFTMHTEQFEMQMDLSGKKIGTCDNPE